MPGNPKILALKFQRIFDLMTRLTGLNKKAEVSYEASACFTAGFCLTFLR